MTCCIIDDDDTDITLRYVFQGIDQYIIAFQDAMMHDSPVIRIIAGLSCPRLQKLWPEATRITKPQLKNIIRDSDLSGESLLLMLRDAAEQWIMQSSRKGSCLSSILEAVSIAIDSV